MGFIVTVKHWKQKPSGGMIRPLPESTFSEPQSLMSLLSLILVFILEQVKPLDYARWIVRPFAMWANWLEKHSNVGDYRHGALAAAIVLLVPAGIVGALWWGARMAGDVPLFLLYVVVLYGVMGVRQFSHFYTDIQMALRLEDIDRARDLLGAWRRETLPRYGAPDIARLSIETALVDAHRHVFAVLCWFALLGPVGALLYRLTHLLAETWPVEAKGEFGRFAQQCFTVADWLPMRVTAATFAFVGNFVDAAYCWRHRSARWRNDANGIILASGGGALGVRLGFASVGAQEGAEAPVGEIADVEFMQGAIGLVWRAIAFWLLALFVLGLVKI